MAEAPATDPAADAVLGAVLLAIAPRGLGGAVLRGPAGALRTEWLARFAALLPEGSPVRKVPAGIGEDRLIGGLDLAATLAEGRPVLQQGLIGEADDGALVLAMAERLASATIAPVVSAHETGRLLLARDGFEAERSTRFALIALDEGFEPDEHPPEALLDRLGIRIDLDRLGRVLPARGPGRAEVAAARERLAAIVPSEDLITALCETAIAFGILSFRAVLQALACAAAHAALQGRTAIEADDAAIGARLVLSPRARQLPSVAEAPATEQPEPAEAATSEHDAEQQDREIDPSDEPPVDDLTQSPNDQAQEPETMTESICEAVAAALPPAVLAGLVAQGGTGTSAGEGRSGETAASAKRGRPIGSRRGDWHPGARLALLDTLRAAAPWQPIRRRHARPDAPPILVRPEDFRLRRFRERQRATTLFVVDASGSAALHRLAEAKGAVELLLAECYVRRDEVALVAFRGQDADVLLPPTRALARAKRSLARLPGGGGTPLAAGLRAAHLLALDIRRKGNRPALVFLTDGQANVALDGTAGRARAEQDALLAARALRASKLPCLVIDSGARPQQRAERLADAMGARYLPMPLAGIEGIAGAVRLAG